MGLESKADCGESRFVTYVEGITQALGHADRATPFRSYCAGLLLPGDRKSVEPMAARVEPGRVQAAHQSLHHFVAKADWSDEAVLAAVRGRVLPVVGPIRALIVDDTGIPKKGTHSVGVARQYCGQLGKQDNCQVAVSLSAANDHASLPIAYRLYLPHEWADDPDRRALAGVPDEIVFQTKPQIALDQIRAARAAGIEAELVLADAGYGNDTDFATASPTSACPMPSASSPPPPCGHLALSLCRPSHGAGGGVRPRRSVVTRNISRCRPSNWLWLCLRKPGGGSPGGKEPTPSLPRVSPRCASALPIATTNDPRRASRSGA